MRTPIALILAALTATTTVAVTPTGEKTPGAEESTKPANPAPGRPVIRLGMTPEEIIKAIGKPEKIEAVDTPAGKGEQWFYRRFVREDTQQVAATVEMVPAFTGVGLQSATTDVAVPVNHTEIIKTYQVSSLLFIEGKLQGAKQWPEKERRLIN